MRTRVRSTAVLLVLAATCLTFSFAGGAPAGAAGAGGPVIIMGIDGEDGGHGPIATYEAVVTNIKNQVTNGGTGILVIGSGKGADAPTTFWQTIGTDLGIPITFVNGDANIAAQSFAGFGMLAVSGIDPGTSGGITEPEQAALATRSFDVATFVNGGGGLITMQQGDNASSYGFLGDLGTFVSEPIFNGNDQDIDVTADGVAAGLSDSLDVCCWHDQFTVFPSFLTVLATYATFDPAEPAEVAALGGANVQIPTGIVLDPPTQTHFAGEICAVTATVTENEAPAVGKEVRFTITAGPNSPGGGVATSDASGKAVFQYVAPNVGNDTITAEFTDTQGRIRSADAVTCGIFAPPTTTTTTAAPTTTAPAPPPAAAAAVRTQPRFTG